MSMVRISKGRWLRWLCEYDGPGFYGRQNPQRSAEFVYNHTLRSSDDAVACGGFWDFEKEGPKSKEGSKECSFEPSREICGSQSDCSLGSHRGAFSPVAFQPKQIAT